MYAPSEIETIELDLLLEAIQRRCGYDFRHYARSSMRRRPATRLAESNLTSLADMIPRVLHDDQFLEQAIRTLSISISITVTEMFRDPQVYRTPQVKVFPALRVLDAVKTWNADGAEIGPFLGKLRAAGTRSVIGWRQRNRVVYRKRSP